MESMGSRAIGWRPVMASAIRRDRIGQLVLLVISSSSLVVKRAAAQRASTGTGEFAFPWRQKLRSAPPGPRRR